MEGIAVMEVALAHPDSSGFPEDMSEYDYGRDGFFVVGIIRQGGGPWFPLVVDESRTLMTMLDGGVEISVLPDEARELYVHALINACERLFGPDWPIALSQLLDINRRAVQRGRIFSNLLPPRFLTVLSYVASADDGEELATAMMAMVKYDKRCEGDEQKARRHWADVADVFYGAKGHLGVRGGKPPIPA